jgi:hypothetical protein
MKSLNKVHWFQSGSGLSVRFKWFLNNSGKDEITTSAYLSGTPMFSVWGNVGVLVDGYVTLAANSMDSIISGYSHEYLPDMLNKYKSSGVPKRAGVFDVPLAPRTDFVLDSASFKPSMWADNEFIVDNWKVKALVLGQHASDEKYLSKTIEMAKENRIPVIDMNGKEVVNPEFL